jgi:glycosyltransferase involved in cell wall biosynthesis
MPRVALVIPAYNNPTGLERVLDSLPGAGLHRVYVVDDGSREPLRAPAPARLLRHPRNRGYGAAQKTGYAAALANGADRVVLLHGDAQYPTGPTLALAEALDEADCALGSRFLDDGGAAIPGWRRAGNRALTAAANLRFGRAHTELHTGARAFRAEALARLPLEDYSDDFVFDQQVLVGLFARGMRVVERPVRARYDPDVQSISPRRAVRYGLGCLWAMARPR